GGGSIFIMPTSGTGNPLVTTLAANQPITFANSAGVSGSIATLNLNGGPVFITTSGGLAAAVSINSGVSLAATGDLTATSAGNLNVNGSVFANNLTLQTSANNSSINVNADVTGASSVAFSANGSGNVTQAVGTLVSTPVLNLSSGFGNVTIGNTNAGTL